MFDDHDMTIAANIAPPWSYAESLGYADSVKGRGILSNAMNHLEERARNNLFKRVAAAKFDDDAAVAEATMALVEIEKAIEIMRNAWGLLPAVAVASRVMRNAAGLTLLARIHRRLSDRLGAALYGKPGDIVEDSHSLHGAINEVLLLAGQLAIEQQKLRR